MHIIDGSVVIEVIDTGMGMGMSNDPSEVNKSEGAGTGLNNVRGRLQALYGDTASLNVYENTPRGLRVQLVMPVVGS